MVRHSVEQTRQSNQATFPFRIVYLDYRLVGVHEDLDTKVEKEVYDSMFDHGYYGPPVTVFESGNDTLFNSGSFDTKVEEEYGVFGVADGHHRFKSIKLLGEKGLLKEVYIPFQLVPAHKSDVIRIGTLYEDEKPLSLATLEACFKDPSATIPICTSHFQTKLATGEWARLQASQPSIKVDKIDFIAA